MAEDRAETVIGFSCIGRWTKAGPFGVKGNKKPGKGCDWTLGGLFKLHEVEIVTEDGKHHPYFHVATPQEAQNLEATGLSS